MKTWRATEPSSCIVCSIPERFHAQRWTTGAGWHKWIRPTRDVIWARMVIRRQERDRARWIRWDDYRTEYRRWGQ